MVVDTKEEIVYAIRFRNDTTKAAHKSSLKGYVLRGEKIEIIGPRARRGSTIFICCAGSHLTNQGGSFCTSGR